MGERNVSLAERSEKGMRYSAQLAFILKLSDFPVLVLQHQLCSTLLTSKRF
jgi:uncharacterized BrkB/YihY/UPF0761 family membrane protein